MPTLLEISCVVAYLIGGFATMVLDSHESTKASEAPWRVFCFFFWPIPVSMLLVVSIWMAMDETASRIADRIKGRK